MAKDLFGGLGGLGDGLGGLMKGLTSMMPQDDPNVQLIKAQTEAGDLAKQEMELYVEIGKQAVQKYGMEEFGELADKMKLVQTNLAAAREKLNSAKGEQEAKEKAEKELQDSRTCPACGHENPEGVKFCQECGAKVGIKKNICPSCGMENPQGVKFCGGCGSRLEE
jgi:ribosomal protein L40E